MKKNLKYLLALCLTIALVFSLAACGQKADETPNDAQNDQQTEQEEFTPASYSIAALKGPTAMGLVKLMKDSESGETTGNEYTFTLAGSADEVTPALLKGELDMACVPANLAAVLYNKTEGEIEVLAVNTLGVLYIVENGESVHSMADLKGKTIVAAGKGSTPEYALRYLLTENGIDPDNDVTIDWKSEHSECVAALASGQASVALLPQPFVTVAQSKIEGLRMALDLTKEWDALDNGSARHCCPPRGRGGKSCRRGGLSQGLRRERRLGERQHRGCRRAHRRIQHRGRRRRGKGTALLQHRLPDGGRPS